MRRHLALAYQSLHETDVLRAAVTDGRDALTQWFGARFGGQAFACGSARAALRALLESGGFAPGDEVIVCGFTCVAVPEAVLYADLVPVYADIAPGAWSSGRAEVAAVASERTRVVIVQHTYGVPHELEEIVALARASGWLVIEDCALALAGAVQVGVIGSQGDASIVSFEMTKTVTAGWGGIAVVRNPELLARMRLTCEALPVQSVWQVSREFAQVLTSTTLFRPQVLPFSKYLVAALYRFGLYRKSGRPLEARAPEGFSVRIARWQASLVAAQLQRLPGIAAHARHVAGLYATWLRARGWREEAWLRDATLLRFPLLLEGALEKVRALSPRGFELGRWFDAPVAPMPDPPRRVGYTPGTCPRAERVAAHIVNLPLHVRMSDGDVARLLAALDELGARPLQLPAD